MSTSLSEAYREDPLQLQHIVPLDFHKVHAVPDTHTWPQSEDYSSSNGGHSSISMPPIVDLLDSNVVELLGHACETWGVFQITNHGIPLSLIEEVESEARRFFSLPAHHKEKVLRSPDGATGYGLARISAFFPKFMWHEGFTIMGSSAHDHARKLWPHDYTHFCDVMDEYQKKVKALAHNLFLLLLKSLDVSKEDLNWAASIGKSEGALQLNSYPPCPDPDCALGLAPHTDSMLLTVLHQSNTDGLQIFREGSGWVSVSPVAGALVVNVGDLLHILSNARLHTVYHRAAVNRSRHRISVAYFFGPPADSSVTPFSKLGFPRFRSLTLKEYLKIKAKHLGKALSLIEI